MIPRLARTFIAALVVLPAGYAAAAGATASNPPQYMLNVRLTPGQRTMHVAGTMILASANPSAGIRLSLAAAASNVHFAMADRRLAISSRATGDGNTVWTLTPAKARAKDLETRIRFYYDLGGPQGQLFYLGPEVAFASAWGTNWYPVALDGQSKGIGMLHIHCPKGWQAIANDHPIGNGGKPGGDFRYQIDHPTYLSFAAGPYAMANGGGTPPLSAYVLGPHENLPNLLKGAAMLMQAQAKEFGAFPFRSFTMVEIPRDIANKSGFNAASLPGVIWVNSNAFEAPKIDYMLEWLGHEFTHQWFPQSVALNTPPGLYMEEAVAEFGGWHAVDTILGARASERLRRTGFEFDPIYSASTYFKSLRDGHDRPLAALQGGLEDRNLAYNKGAFVFFMLSEQIGDGVLSAAFHRITETHAFQDISWEQFLTAIEETSGRDLHWFYAQWFDRAGAPEFNLSWHQEGGRLAGTVGQSSPYYRAKMEIGVTGAGGRSQTSIIEVGAEATTAFSIPVEFEATQVVLDPSYKILRWTPDYRVAPDVH